MEIHRPEDCEGRYQVESKEYSWLVKKMDFLFLFFNVSSDLCWFFLS